MKRLIFAFALLTASLQMYAQANQCPGCAINAACDNPSANFPALCPAVLPNGTQGQAYDQDLTFFMPDQIDASGFSGLNLEEVTVVGISGIPAGLSWTTNHYPTNFYAITSDPNTQRGCAKICGTPLLSGSYSATVNVIVKVCDIPVVGCTTLTQTFVLPLEIEAVAGGNPYFSFTPQTGCDSVDVTYTSLLNLGLPQVTEYEWDFGGGNTFSGPIPPPQSYGAPGIYSTTLVTNVFDHVFTSLSASVNGGWWCGDIEELNCGSGNADMVFTLTHGTASYTSPEITDNPNPSWTNLGIVLTNMTIGLQFSEIDVVSPTDNGGNYAFVVPGPGTYTFSTTAVSSGGGGVTGSFTIEKQLFNSYSATDTVIVYELPPVTDIDTSGSLNLCSGEVLPTLSVYGGYNYEWIMNDTTVIAGASDSSYTVTDPGISYPYTATYKVKIIDPNTGCATITPNITIVINEPIPSSFGTFGASYFNGQLTSNFSGFASYQWLLNGTPLIPLGQTQTFTPTVNGSYKLVVTNSFGCVDTSNAINVFNMGINEISGLDAFVSVFPNPSNGEFTLNMEAPVSSDLTVALIDVSGKTVYTENLGKYNKTLHKTFDLKGLSAGVYTLNIVMEQGTIRRKLIIR